MSAPGCEKLIVSRSGICWYGIWQANKRSR